MFAGRYVCMSRSRSEDLVQNGLLYPDNVRHTSIVDRLRPTTTR
jgi:hypothetical protein